MLFRLDPYCGHAPSPAGLVHAWNFDPWLLGVFGICALWAMRRSGTSSEMRCRIAGVAILAACFFSPLCALSSALFSARAVHHLLLTSLAAPLIWQVMKVGWLNRCPAILPFAAHTSALWLWHVPVVYSFALSGSVQYWTMEIPLLLSALWLWREILDPDRPAGAALVLCLATMLQMTVLGAWLTFAPHPIFAPHFATTELYGLSALQDQQLAGLLVWVPASLPFAVAFLLRTGRVISASRTTGGGSPAVLGA
ncbi:cytochrome c oxidase assembly protein [Rhizobium sp. RAF56]|uniref:cytochrome c oxidase assembly protein n=1 Tax=Rhizobium sp. RAF56 TaxID=3233062 RepID=UPI003F96E0B2